jgi:hypothetical protein
MLFTVEIEGYTPENFTGIHIESVDNHEILTSVAYIGVPYRPGDVDGDGVVTIEDAVEILRYLAKVESAVDKSLLAYKAACVTGGESPTIKDALEIMRNLTKKT